MTRDRGWGLHSRTTMWNARPQEAILDEAGLAYTRKGQTLRISTDKTAITSKAPALSKIADLVKKSWEE